MSADAASRYRNADAAHQLSRALTRMAFGVTAGTGVCVVAHRHRRRVRARLLQLVV